MLARHEPKFLVDIMQKDGTMVTRCVIARSVYDGGMVEFYDPDTKQIMGCIGINIWEKLWVAGEIGIVDDTE